MPVSPGSERELPRSSGATRCVVRPDAPGTSRDGGSDALRVAAAYLGVLAALGCGRVEEPRPPEARPAQALGAREAAAPSATRPAPSRTRPPCLVPTPEKPPPAATAAQHCPPAPSPPPALPRARVSFPEAPEAPSLEVERALDDEHRARGLMWRTSLGEREGMLFSWDEDAPQSFWMRNTCIPLDMLFIARDGTILGIVEQVPVLNDEPRGIPCPVAHVLEVPAGWARRHGVRAGQRVAVE